MNTIELLHQQYDKLYDEIDNLTKGLNICKFENGSCKRNRELKYNNPYCCCGHASGREVCQHFVVGKGCNTKAIACKTWFCGFTKVPTEIALKLGELKNEAEKQGFYVYRGDFNDVLKRKDLL